MIRKEYYNYETEYIHLIPFSSGHFFQYTGIEPTSVPISHFTYKLPKRHSLKVMNREKRELYKNNLIEVLVFNAYSYNRFLKRCGYLEAYDYKSILRDYERLLEYLFEDIITETDREKILEEYNGIRFRYDEAVRYYRIKYKGGIGSIHFYERIIIRNELENIILENIDTGRFRYGDEFLERFGYSRGSIRNICSKYGIESEYDKDYGLDGRYRIIKHKVRYTLCSEVEESDIVDEWVDDMDYPFSYNWIEKNILNEGIDYGIYERDRRSKETQGRIG